jgi:hypothetical protein
MHTRILGLTLVAAALLVVPGVAEATGFISGVVIDGLTGQPVRGATVAVDGTDLVFTTDLGGAFRGETAAGTYSVTVTHEGFDAQRVEQVVVADGELADFAVVLLPASGDSGAVDGGDAAFTGEITVTADPVTSSQVALLTERKNAAQISDSIGKEEFSKNAGSDAADVVKRVVGISLQDDKYVFVRGLGDRYSNTSLNGSKIPSTEFDKKVVPLDLYPADLLDTIKVSKSYTADKPGDFAAGLVEMETLDFPASQSASVGFSMGSNSTSTGETFGQYAGGLSTWGDGGPGLDRLEAGGRADGGFVGRLGSAEVLGDRHGRRVVAGRRRQQHDREVGDAAVGDHDLGHPLGVEAGPGHGDRVGAGGRGGAEVAADAGCEADVGAVDDQGGAAHRLAGEAVDDDARDGAVGQGRRRQRDEAHADEGRPAQGLQAHVVSSVRPSCGSTTGAPDSPARRHDSGPG